MIMAMRSIWKNFLCLFVQEHTDFRIQELQSLVSIAHSEVKYEHTSYSNENPHLIVQLESEAVARQILNRSLLLRSMFELWGWGRDYDDLKSSIQSNMTSELMEPYTRDDYTFRLTASGFSRRCSSERQKMIFEKLSFLPFNGKVALKNPTHAFQILEDYGDCAKTAPQEPLRIFFGRLIGHGQRELILRYSIKNRHFIGNTSMDPQLSLIMANQAKVTSGDFVLDPFAGTGGILVACAHFGGYVMGSDIDWNVVHGKGRTTRAGSSSKYRGQKESLLANLQQYKLESRFVDMLVADAATCTWTRQELFDAIVTDPPYGVREGGRKVGFKSKEKTIPQDCKDGHFPEIKAYKLSELYFDLLQFAAKFLVVGGRLVYWLPVVKTELTALPQHPCLRLVSCSLQPLQRHVGRNLVTMEKCKSWEEYKLDQGEDVKREQVEEHIKELELHDNFRDKYLNEDRYK